MRPAEEISQRFAEMLVEGRVAVQILGGRFSGRMGALVDHDGAMCVVDLDDDGEGFAAEVRVVAKYVYKVLT